MNKYDKIITLRQETPIIKKEKNILRFIGKVYFEGKECGIITGITEEMPKLKNEENKVDFTRVRRIYFDLSCGQIIAEGISSSYNESGLLNEESQDISIIGGTGKFESVRGKLQTKRFQDTNEHEHILFLRFY